MDQKAAVQWRRQLWAGPTWADMSSTRAWVLVGVIAALAASAFGWWRVEQGRAAWAASVAPIPDLAVFPAELRARVEALTARARDGSRDVAALGELGRLYHANGFAREAMQAYAGLERFDAANARWPHLVAHQLAGSGRLEEAVPHWRRATELAPDYVPARVRLGEALLKTNASEAAADAYATALAIAPQHEYALLGLARCELQLGRMTAARERLQAAAAAQPEFGAAWNLLATVYDRLGNSEGASAAQARADSKRRFREMSDPWLDELLGECYDVYRLRVAAAAANAASDPQAAIPWLERAARLAPDAPAVRRDLGTMFMARHEHARARAEFERAIALAPADESGYLQLITCCEDAGDAAGAERAAAAGAAQVPGSAGLRFVRGKHMLAAGRLEEALAEFAEARRLQPEAPEAYYEMAGIYFRRGQDTEGRAVLEDAATRTSAPGRAMLALAQRAIETGDGPAAQQWLERARGRTDVAAEGFESLVRGFQRRFGREP